MKISRLLVAAAALAVLSGCGGGSDDSGDAGAEDSSTTTAGDSGGASSGTGSDDEISFRLETAAEQLTKSLADVKDYDIDGTTLTFTFSEDKPADGGISSCQIAPTVLDSIAPGEIETIVLAYPDTTTTCEEVLR